MALRIDRKLNLIVPVEREGLGTVYVHSMPISREVFERYFLVIGRAFALIYSKDLNFFAGPRVAKLLLRNAAEEVNAWKGPEGVEAGLLGEIRRLSNVSVPREGGGWETLPYETALARGIFSEDEVEECENNICFFILNSAVQKRSSLLAFLVAMNEYWGTQTTLLNATEYTTSLPTLTPAASSGAVRTQSSVPT